MASASVRLLTQGWSGEQRREITRALDAAQRRMVRDHIRMNAAIQKFEAEEAAEAIRFLDTNGEQGSSFGIVEYAAAVLFGTDPAFRATWQSIRRGAAAA